MWLLEDISGVHDVKFYGLIERNRSVSQGNYKSGITKRAMPPWFFSKEFKSDGSEHKDKGTDARIKNKITHKSPYIFSFKIPTIILSFIP
jgi:hypothetical protein